MRAFVVSNVNFHTMLYQEMKAGNSVVPPGQLVPKNQIICKVKESSRNKLASNDLTHAFNGKK